ncbi:MAG: glucosaminidase domain-containing protein [Bacteroidales bacterium]|jgi:flagellar protein FlgJ|nr:glucosaminidase domain-containing protein [Bacteroidales bacterium]
MTHQEFIKTYSEDVILATNYTPLFPSVMMAQAALETGWGNSTIGVAKNMFGMKAAGTTNQYWKGGYILAKTIEEINGVNQTIQAKFRTYLSYQDSIKDHNNLLMTLARYKPVRDAKTPEEQALALQSSGYATDTGYANKLINIINSNNLKSLDLKKKL